MSQPDQRLQELADVCEQRPLTAEEFNEVYAATVGREGIKDWRLGLGPRGTKHDRHRSLHRGGGGHLGGVGMSAEPTQGGAGALEIMAKAAYDAFLADGHPSLDGLPSWDDQAEDIREYWREKTREQFGAALLALYTFWEISLEAGMQQQRAEYKGVWRKALAQKITAELHADAWGCLDGPLGDRIAEEAGSYSLEFVTPEQLAEGIVEWLEAGE